MEQPKPIQNPIPLEKLAPSGRIQKAQGVRQKKDEVERRQRGEASRPLPPGDRGDEGAGDREEGKGYQCIGRVAAVGAASHRGQL